MKKLLNILIFLLFLLLNISVLPTCIKGCARSSFSKIVDKYPDSNSAPINFSLCTLNKKDQKIPSLYNYSNKVNPLYLCHKTIQCIEDYREKKKKMMNSEKFDNKNVKTVQYNNNIFKNLLYFGCTNNTSKNQYDSSFQTDHFSYTLSKRKSSDSSSQIFLNKCDKFYFPCLSIYRLKGDLKSKKTSVKPKKIVAKNIKSEKNITGIIKNLSYLDRCENICKRPIVYKKYKKLNFTKKTLTSPSVPKSKIELKNSDSHHTPLVRRRRSSKSRYELQNSKTQQNDAYNEQSRTFKASNILDNKSRNLDSHHTPLVRRRHFSESRYELQNSVIQQNDAYEEQARIFKVNSILNNMPTNTLERLELLGFSEPSSKKINKADPKKFFSLISDITKDCFKKMINPLVLVVVIMAVCSVFKSFFPQCSKNFSNDLINVACILSMALFLILPFSETILYVSDIFKISCKLLLCYIPAIAGIMISSGQCFTSFVHSTFLIGFANFILQISSNAFVPILNALLAFACTCAVSSCIDFSGIFIAISKSLKILLGILVTVFVGFFRIKVSVNLAAEGAGTKALKFLLGSCIPVIGKALSDAASTIRGSLNLLKTNTCAFFIVSMVITFLPALMQCLLWHITTLVCASVGESLQLSEISKFLKNLTEITGIIITLIICFLIVIISSTLIVMRSTCNTS